MVKATVSIIMFSYLFVCPSGFNDFFSPKEGILLKKNPWEYFESLSRKFKFFFFFNMTRITLLYMNVYANLRLGLASTML
jgi:hypothetical protein